MIGDFLKHRVFGHQAPDLFLNGLTSEIKESLNISPAPVIRTVKAEALKLKESNINLVKDSP
jgi:hypothetical protein